MCKHVIVKSRFMYELQVLQRFQTTKVIFKPTQGHWQSCHSIAHIWFPICLPLWLCLYLAPFQRYYRLFSKT